jgi:hypothetical protein
MNEVVYNLKDRQTSRMRINPSRGDCRELFFASHGIRGMFFSIEPQIDPTTTDKPAPYVRQPNKPSPASAFLASQPLQRFAGLHQPPVPAHAELINALSWTEEATSTCSYFRDV